mmetsp:Transcript_8859/g.29164  ORF Transcript_8859/g.29164 Transcript_8859/m.29164 type:complete len:221 (-) Transcript_8859:700-1362(-)
MSASPSASTSVVASGCASTNSAPSWSTTSLMVSYLVRTLRNICCCNSTVSVIFSIRAFDFSRDRSKALTVVSLASACSTRSRIASTSFSLVSAFSSASLIRVCKASTSFFARLLIALNLRLDGLHGSRRRRRVGRAGGFLLLELSHQRLDTRGVLFHLLHRSFKFSLHRFIRFARCDRFRFHSFTCLHLRRTELLNVCFERRRARGRLDGILFERRHALA